MRGNSYSTLANASQASAKILLEQAEKQNRSLYDFSRDEGLQFLGHLLDAHLAGTTAMAENPEWEQIGIATQVCRKNIEEFLNDTKENWNLIYARYRGNRSLEMLMTHLDPECYKATKSSTSADGNKQVQPQEQVILLVHGIRTFANWQPMVKRVLEEIPNTKVIPIKYGYFDALRFWFPWFTRQTPIDDLRREIQNTRATNPEAQLSVIAHSFGTYAISRILVENPDITLRRLILSGSIIPRSYRWDYVRERLGTDVVNDFGTRDIWPVLAKCLSWGYGDTGRHGFGRAGVIDRGHDYAHSDFFNEQFVRDFWQPLFRSDLFVESPWDEKAPPPSCILSILSVLPLQWIFCVVLIVALILRFGSNALRSHDNKEPKLHLGPKLISTSPPQQITRIDANLATNSHKEAAGGVFVYYQYLGSDSPKSNHLGCGVTWEKGHTESYNLESKSSYKSGEKLRLILDFPPCPQESNINWKGTVTLTLQRDRDGPVTLGSTPGFYFHNNQLDDPIPPGNNRGSRTAHFDFVLP